MPVVLATSLAFDLSPLPPVVAVNMNFGSITQGSGTQLVDVLAAPGTTYQGTPTVVINSQVPGGLGATVDTSGSRPQLAIPKGTLQASCSVTWTLTATGSSGSSQATASGAIVAALAGVSLPARLEVFSRATYDVTTLSGWPAGRLPSKILAHGAHCGGYIRRAWKPNNNNGRYIDFISGWQSTTSPESISLQLDNGSTVALNYEVQHTLPSPTGGGTTRTLDRAGGANFTTWASAISSLTSGDVLVVRASTGTWTDSGGHSIPNYVYDVSNNVTPPGGVTGVRIVAHPSDIAAGRRPVIFRNANLYARFKYAAFAAWRLKQSLGSEGAIYESVSTFSRPAHSYVGCYKDQLGHWMVMYAVQAMTDGTNRAFVLQDTSYNRASTPMYVSNVYVGPAIIYNIGTSRFECRLTPPPKKVIMNPSSSAPFPPWDWTKHYPPSLDARQCEIILTDGNTYGSANLLLDLSNRGGWRFYNLDFAYGNWAIKTTDCNTQPQFYGCSFVGGATPELNNTGQNISYLPSAIASDTNSFAPGTDMLFDRCTVDGHSPPWACFAEGKGYSGNGGLSQRRDFYSPPRSKTVFRFCHLRNWWTLTWMGFAHSPALKFHMHHCWTSQCAQDGCMLLTIYSPNLDSVVNRNFMTPYQGTAFVTLGSDTSFYHFSFNVDLRLHPMASGTVYYEKFVSGGYPQNVSSYVNNQSVAHGGRSQHPERRYYNTHVGSECTAGSEMTNGGEGCGSGAGTDGRFGPHRIYNCIGAVYPATFAWPAGSSAYVVAYANLGGVNDFDYNLWYKAPGMLPPAKGRNTFFIVQSSGQGAGTAIGDIGTIRSTYGWDIHSEIADPQFVVTPRSSLTNPYAPGGIFDLGNYLLGSSSPARTGGRNLNDQGFPDYDFETLTTWTGGNNALWRGALDPNLSEIEQEVGIPGPFPPNLT